jgi:MscS family membrane protein
MHKSQTAVCRPLQKWPPLNGHRLVKNPELPQLIPESSQLPSKALILKSVPSPFGGGHAKADVGYPLESVDTSSPRATLTSFFAELEGAWEVFRDEYWEAPSYEIYLDIIHGAGRTLRTLDLSEVAPSARIEVGYEAFTLLHETLARIELPPMEEIPDASAFEHTEGPARWTIPHTDITIARVTEGTRKGEFLFSPATIERVHEFYQRTRALPYKRDVPVENTTRVRQLHPGWWVSMAIIESLPEWMKRVVFNQAVWKWGAFAVMAIIASVLVLLVYRIARGEVSENLVTDYFRRLAAPIFVLLLIPGVAFLITEQINLVGAVAKYLLLILQTIKYLLATWVAWLGSLLVAEMLIASPKVEDDSLNAQLLRLSARIIGIAIGLTTIFYGANQIGLPVVGVLAGVGVGGLAIALAAQDSLKNLLGSLMIFMDKPYKPGQRIVVEGHDGFVEQIGLRSTKIRMLTGAQTSIPNERMARLDIENIGRRSFIRRQSSIRLSYDTPAAKVRKAVEIIKDILHNHEGMREELPPRVFFDEFNPDSLNIFVSYWYHPPRRWKAMQFDERINLEIMERFAEADIKLALPAIKNYLSREDEQSVKDLG